MAGELERFFAAAWADPLDVDIIEIAVEVGLAQLGDRGYTPTEAGRAALAAAKENENG